MIATQCPSAHQLQALALGRLSDEQSDKLFDHVRQCESCRAELETVADSDDSLIASLRTPDPVARFDDEPDCRVAVAKALGALALAGDASTGTDLNHLPQCIGEYEIVRPLGRGGMGSVFLARHTKLGREVALKIVAGHRLADPRMRERFAAEMRAVGRLSHPNVVAAHDAREVDGTAVLVTEYIDGFDLGQLVQRSGPLSIADACEIVRLAAVALQYTSEQGFVHRDVKPSNIMLSRSGEVKLLDLGLARVQLADGEQAGVTGTGQTMGTADYVAPEQVTDSRSVDVRADLYSLGCTLFKLLTGAAPFSGPEYATVFAKMTAHVSTRPPSLADRLPDAPPALVKLVDAMLAKDPAKRPRTPEAVAAKLAAFAQESDLPRLAWRAGALEPAGPASLTDSAPPSSNPHRTLPLLSRTVPMPIAIGGGLLGLLLGFFLGILITIEYPDGTVLRATLPPGTNVTLGAAAGDAGSAGLSEIHPAAQGDTPPPGSVSSFSGLWRVVMRSGGQELADTELVMGFQFGGYHLVNPSGPQSQGRFLLEPDGSGIELVDEMHQGRMVGLYRFLPSGELQLLLTEDSSGDRPSRFDPQQYPSADLMTLKRIGAFPYKTEESRALVTGQSPGMTRAIALSLMLAHVDPVTMGPELQQQARAAAGISQARSNLWQIALAFHNFHDTYQKFPGSSNRRSGARTPENGKPIQPFSWRVAILPFLDQNELYQQYRFDEPWDSKHNLTLLSKMPAVYRSPWAGDDQEWGDTNHQGFVGESTALGTGEGVSLRDFTDGVSNTLLVLETRATVPWTKPQDLPFDQPEDARNASAFDNRPLSYVTADGAVHAMDPIEWEKLAMLITRDGGERDEP